MSDKSHLLSRDLSLIGFNERVLNWATRADVPILERLRYLTIVSSNLDEFFEVRMQEHLDAMRGKRGKHPTQDTAEYQALSQRIQRLVQSQYTIYNQKVLPSLKKHGIRLVSDSERTQTQKKWVKQYFTRDIQPLLVPISLDPSHPFPQVASKALHFVVRLGGKDAFGRSNEFAIIAIPRFFPRFIQLPATRQSKTLNYVSLSSVLRSHIGDLFSGRVVLEFSQFRVTRHSDVAVHEDEVKNLRKALQAGLQKRPFGEAVRIEVATAASNEITQFLLAQFELPPEALYKVDGPVNLVRAQQLIGLVEKKEFLFPSYQASTPKALRQSNNYFDLLDQEDVLLHHPYQSFEPVLELLKQAVFDPDVAAIRQTIYRTGRDSRIIDLLEQAVLNGKVVMVVMEIKARFDEEANIAYADRLEKAGAQVVYGIQGLKTHAKMMLITRRQAQGFKRYVHLATGNYNPNTAGLYTDLGFMTADAGITEDVERIFQHLASQNRAPKLDHLQIAPFTLHKRLLEEIKQAAQAAASGVPARIRCKMNSLTDHELARQLIDAANSGVKVDLIVRGACITPCLPETATGGYLTVRSVIGRFLEHSRVFSFMVGDRHRVWLSSADFMSRNMHGRIEVAWPVNDEKLANRIVNECLDTYLLDSLDAWNLTPTGEYVLAKSNAADKRDGMSAQRTLMSRYDKSGDAWI
ncbi:MAG: polyphosphate kinase 1 [Burkholderiaceae bacterium]